MSKIPVKSVSKTGQSTQYEVQLGPTHSILRRYRDFEELHQFLLRRYQAVGRPVPDLPGKKAGINKASSTEKNRQQLEVFVNQLLFQPTFVKDNDVLRFFEIKPVEQGQAEVPEEAYVPDVAASSYNGHVAGAAAAAQANAKSGGGTGYEAQPDEGAALAHQMGEMNVSGGGGAASGGPASGGSGGVGGARGGGGGALEASRAWEGVYQARTEEEVICFWIRDLLGVELDPLNLQAGLRSGVVICNLVNRISPGKIPAKRISASEAPFPQRENIECFVGAVKSLGIRETDMMDPGDLFDGRNMRQVVINLYALGRLCYTIPGYEGPALGRPENYGKEGGVASTKTGSPVNSVEGNNQQQHHQQMQQQQQKNYKWDVKAGGSYVPKTPAQLAMEREQREIAQAPSQGKQRQWEVKFAPQLATASRRTMVVTTEERVQKLMSKFNLELGAAASLKTAMGGGAGAQQEQYDDDYDSDEDDDDEEFDGASHAGVIEGLLMMLQSSDATEKAKAAAALCNICSETDGNRELVVKHGGLPSLIQMLEHPSPEVPFMQSAAAACICNLAANLASKDYIATSGAVEVLVKVLSSENHAAAAQAAGALWSLCVDNDGNKQKVAEAGAIIPLIGLLVSADSFAQSQSAGALSECSIRNDTNKRLISQHGAITPLVAMLNSEDLSVQRLASCALCNVCANHEGNKHQARLVGALPVLVRLVQTSQVPEVLSPVAGAICNLSMKCPENAKEFVNLGAVQLLQQLVASPIPSLHGNALAALEQLVDE